MDAGFPEEAWDDPRAGEESYDPWPKTHSNLRRKTTVSEESKLK